MQEFHRSGSSSGCYGHSVFRNYRLLYDYNEVHEREYTKHRDDATSQTTIRMPSISNCNSSDHCILPHFHLHFCAYSR
ncbi:hypothetical protein PMAYCL1PPCAC_14844, partial [Pristionchus mayeri]